MKKLFLRSNSPSITYLFPFFTGRTNIQKFWSGMSTGRLRDPVAGRSWNQMMGRSKDVRGTSVKYVFQIKITNTLNLLWQVTQDFIVNGSSEKFNEQDSG